MKNNLAPLMVATTEAFGNEERATPWEFFDELNRKWRFTLDPCATAENAKCKKFFTKSDNGLMQRWAGHTVFCNPPYGRMVQWWIDKAIVEMPYAVTVMLLPARTDTRWFQKLVLPHALAVKFLPGRLKFEGCKDPAPFPSMLVYF